MIGMQLLALSIGLSTINHNLQGIRHELTVLNRSLSNANVQSSGSPTYMDQQMQDLVTKKGHSAP